MKESGASGVAAEERPVAPLRVGVMLDDLTVPNWVLSVIADVQTSRKAHIVLCVRRRAPRAHKDSIVDRIANAIRSRWRAGLYYRYLSWDYERHRAVLDAFEPVDAGPTLRHCEMMDVEPDEGRFTDRFQSDDLRAIESHELDVLLRFGFRILKGPILHAARYGVWSFHHGDNTIYRGGPAGFWEVFEGAAVCGVVLQRLTRRLDDGIVLHRSFSATNLTSLYATRNAAYWKAVGAVRRRLEDLFDLGWAEVQKLEPQPTKRGALDRLPGTFAMLHFLLRLRVRILGFKLRNALWTERWSLAIGRSAGIPGDRPSSLIPVVAPRDRFYADPFLAEHEGRTYVFFEDFRFADQCGRISCAELVDGHLQRPEIVLETGSHLAYPFVFEWAGDMYLVPESASSEAVSLYRAREFPHSWELVTRLLTGVAAVDPTIVRVADVFWLFVGIAPPGAPAEHQLHAFHSRDLSGPWLSHRRNPISRDIRRSRPGGRPFMRGQELIRPAQDCSRRYGFAIVLNRVTSLSQDGYEEELVGRLEPQRVHGGVATHTIDFNSRYEVCDVVLRERRLLRGSQV